MTFIKKTFVSRITAPAIIAALAVAFAGCASTPTDTPRLSQLDNSLNAAAGDKYVAEYGQADLNKARASLMTARAALKAGHGDETIHEGNMAESYIALGVIHGRQERMKAETIALNDRRDQIRLASRDADVRNANDKAEIARVDVLLANAAVQNAQATAQSAQDKSARDQAQLAVRDADVQNANDRADASKADVLTANAAAESARAATQKAEDRVAAMRAQLSSYDLKITELGATLVLHDVMFDTDSSLMRDGAVNRLAPLVAYLRSSPATTVRIEGHTDNTGTAAHNNELSLDRANAVKRVLTTNSSVTNNVQTFGSGQDKPVASNATASGREQNRRVEITLQ